MSFNERYAKENKKKEASAEILLTPAAILAQPFITDIINKRNDKKRKQEEQEKPEEEDALKKEAGAWPSKIDHEGHIQEMNTLLTHHMKGEEWHFDRGEMDQARKHGDAAEALREAIHACTEAM